MRLSADLKAFQSRIGYDFRRSDLLVRAVTHSSIGSATRPDNRDNSNDSRFSRGVGGVGMVGAQDIVGRASFVLFSSEGASLWTPWAWRMDRVLEGVE